MNCDLFARPVFNQWFLTLKTNSSETADWEFSSYYEVNFDPPNYLSIQFDFRTEVAIKESQEQGTKLEMLDEAKAMIRVSRHDHIVNFQGICVANDSVYLLLEDCTLGKIGH